MTCNICCDSFNSVTRKNVCCNYCNFLCCKKCFQTYISDEDQVDMSCMNPVCKKQYSDEFIRDNVSKTFYNDIYKKKQEKQFYDIENSFLPATQDLLEVEIQVEKIHDVITAKKQEIKKLQQEIAKLQAEKNEIWYRRKNEKEKEKKTYIRACPQTNCRGFLSDKWNCTLCETNVCKDCHEIKEKDQEHVCDESILESVKMMAKDVKNCPKCATQIYKIDGCDQMFCTRCQVVFSWKTLTIQTGRIHNPHYYQWLRDNNNGIIPREEGDDPCRADETLVREQLLARKINVDKNSTLKMWNIYIAIHHITYVEMARHPVRRTVDINSNMDIRKMYMRNIISKKHFQATLFKRDKASRKKNEFNQVFTLFVQIATEKINVFYNNNEKIYIDTLLVFYKEMGVFIDYINDTFSKIGDKYNCVHPEFDDDFKFKF